jgi:hypothetical protein
MNGIHPYRKDTSNLIVYDGSKTYINPMISARFQAQVSQIPAAHTKGFLAKTIARPKPAYYHTQSICDTLLLAILSDTQASSSTLRSKVSRFVTGYIDTLVIATPRFIGDVTSVGGIIKKRKQVGVDGLIHDIFAFKFQITSEDKDKRFFLQSTAAPKPSKNLVYEIMECQWPNETLSVDDATPVTVQCNKQEILLTMCRMGPIHVEIEVTKHLLWDRPNQLVEFTVFLEDPLFLYGIVFKVVKVSSIRPEFDRFLVGETKTQESSMIPIENVMDLDEKNENQVSPGPTSMITPTPDSSVDISTIIGPTKTQESSMIPIEKNEDQVSPGPTCMITPTPDSSVDISTIIINVRSIIDGWVNGSRLSTS